MNKLAVILLLCLAALSSASVAAHAVAPADSVSSVARLDSVKTQPTPAPVSSPVDIDDDKPRQTLHYYDKHGDPLKEPVLFLATLDTVQKVHSGPVFPLYNGTSVGVNFGDLIFMAFGQRYASFDLNASVSLHNWFFPTAELGLGFAHDTPDKQNFTYRIRPSFYAKLGIDYNFLYKSNPDYRFYIGVRGGFSRFSYSLTDVSISDDYWGESQSFNMTGLKSTAFFGEALLGLNVRIVSGFSLGWSVRFRHMFHKTNQNGSKPWFVPGFGTTSPLGIAVCASWTFAPRRTEAAAAEPTSSPEISSQPEQKQIH